MFHRALCLLLAPALLAGCGSKDSDAKAGSKPATTKDSGAPGPMTDSGATDSAAPPAPYPPPAPDDCITDVTPGHQSLNCEGLSWELTVPDSCLTAACGLIMDVHGFGMNGTLQAAHSKLDTIAPPKGFIVAQPSAPGGLLSSSWTSANDDQVFAIMQRIISVWHVDAKRVHFDGYSMGGWMTWRFICKHADILASAAPLSAGADGVSGSCAFSGAEMPSRELPIFYTHGTTDGLVPFAGATKRRDELIAVWSLDQSEVVSEGPDYQWTRYTNANGTVFEFTQHDWECGFTLGSIALKGHCFPGVGKTNEFLGCESTGMTNAFNWGEEVLKFFIAHPMK